MMTPISRLGAATLAAMTVAWTANTWATEFSFDAVFNDAGGMTTIEFPLQLAAVQQNEVVNFTIFLKGSDGGGAMTLTDVTTLGCSVSAAYSGGFDFMTSEYLTDATYTASCPNTIDAGAEGQLTLDIINEEPMIMVGGPRNVTAGGLYKIGWAHNGGYFLCQTFTLWGTTNPTWWPTNQFLSNQMTSNTVGSIEFPVPTSARFAAQCIPSSFMEIPVFLALETTVEDEEPNPELPPLPGEM